MIPPVIDPLNLVHKTPDIGYTDVGGITSDESESFRYSLTIPKVLLWAFSVSGAAVAASHSRMEGATGAEIISSL